VKVKATGTGELLDSLPKNNVVAELCSDEFKEDYCHDLDGKLATPTVLVLL
jgi:hypothetical protein